MNESISRAAGAAHGQEFGPEKLAALIEDIGRIARCRTTLYEPAGDERRAAASAAAGLLPVVETPATRYAHGGEAA